MACRKHEPVPAIEVPADLSVPDKLSFLLSSGDRWVRCKRCGVLGAYTNGRQKFGAQRPRWCRSPEGASYAAQRVAELSAWLSERMVAQSTMANTD